MSNPLSPQDTPQDDPPGDQPNYDAYRYPSSGESTAAYGSYGSPEAHYTETISEQKNGVAPWALGLGILALVLGLSVLATAFAFIIGAIGIIVGAVALLKGRDINGPGRRTGMAVAGIVFSAISVALSVFFWVVVTVFMSETNMFECVRLTDADERNQCVERSLDEWMSS